MSIYKGLHWHPQDGADNKATWKEVFIWITAAMLIIRGILWLIGAT